MIRSEAELDGLEPALATVVVRMIHACGMVDLVADVAASPGFCAAAKARAAGRQADPLRHGDGRLGRHARAPARRTTRSSARSRTPTSPAWPPSSARRARAAALELWRPQLAGSVVVVGNAPTALFRLLELIEARRRPRPRP